MRDATASTLDAAKTLVDRISLRLQGRPSAAMNKLSGLPDAAKAACDTAAAAVASFLDMPDRGRGRTRGDDPVLGPGCSG